jgi:hypothetical protein
MGRDTDKYVQVSGPSSRSTHTERRLRDRRAATGAIMATCGRSKCQSSCRRLGVFLVALGNFKEFDSMELVPVPSPTHPRRPEVAQLTQQPS